MLDWFNLHQKLFLNFQLICLPKMASYIWIYDWTSTFSKRFSSFSIWAVRMVKFVKRILSFIFHRRVLMIYKQNILFLLEGSGTSTETFIKYFQGFYDTSLPKNLNDESGEKCRHSYFYSQQSDAVGKRFPRGRVVVRQEILENEVEWHDMKRYQKMYPFMSMRLRLITDRFFLQTSIAKRNYVALCERIVLRPSCLFL